MSKELEIQKYLRHNTINNKLQDGALGFLEAEYGIYAKKHNTYPNLILFKYDQLEAKFSERIVQESRGIILDENKDWSVVCYPYDKFWEEDNILADKIDWTSARVLEKLDGSLCTLWFNEYSQEWEVSTSGTPDASGLVGWTNECFKDLFWRTWNELGYKLPNRFKTLCFMFELCRIENKVVCIYESPRLVCHGMRMINGDYSELPIYTEFGPNMIPLLFGWEVIKQYPIQTFEEVIKACEALDPIKNEGFVIVDKNFKRIKVKSVQYKALSHIKDGFSIKRVVELVRQPNQFNWMPYFPEYKDLYEQVYKVFEDLIVRLSDAWLHNHEIQSQKEFALSIKDIDFPGALFNLRAGKNKTIREYFENININTLTDYIKDKLNASKE
jgi:hypothetical protein